jgi:hypothetical protein
MSMAVFRDSLYAGTDRPTELIRIRPNDQWDLVVGEARLTPQGLKWPISGLSTGFGNVYNGHFWRMQEHEGRLYVGTWDWSVQLRTSPLLDPLLRDEFGFDLYTSPDGSAWYRVTRNGFGDGFNYGARSFASTPFGLFVGTANPYYGAEVWQVTPGELYRFYLPLVRSYGGTVE